MAYDANLDVELQQAMKSLQQKVDKLESLQTSASNRGGTMNTDQIDTVSTMLDEIEALYTKHYSKLEQMEEDYNSNIKNLKNTAQNYQDKYNKSIGSPDNTGNSTTSPANDTVQNYYSGKVTESQKNLENAQAQENAGVNQAYARLNEAHNKSGGLQSTMEGYDATSPTTDKLNNGVKSVVSNTFSVGSAIKYLGSGLTGLDSGQQQATYLGQKMSGFNGDDETLRRQVLDTGLASGYDPTQSAKVLQEGLAGGQGTAAKGVNDKTALMTDSTNAMQASRALSINPDTLAQGGASLKKMGAMSDGDMQSFADLIGGSISKQGMKGREDENLSSSLNLIASATSKMADVTPSQANSLIATQADMGSKDAALKGDKGAAVLSTMSQGIQNGNNTTDILMGKGTKYTGIVGQAALDEAKSKGMADPENAKTILQNIQKMTANTTDPATKTAEQEELTTQAFGLSMDQVQTLTKNGTFDDMASGKATSQATIDDLKKSGQTKEAQELETYNKTVASKTATNKVSNTRATTNTMSGPWDTFQNGMHTINGFLNPVAKGIGTAGILAMGGKAVWNAVGNPFSKGKVKFNNSNDPKGGGSESYSPNSEPVNADWTPDNSGEPPVDPKWKPINGENTNAEPIDGDWTATGSAGTDAVESVAPEVGAVETADTVGTAAATGATAVEGATTAGAVATGAETAGGLAVATGMEEAGVAADATGVGLPVGGILAIAGAITAAGTLAYEHFKKPAASTTGKGVVDPITGEPAKNGLLGGTVPKTATTTKPVSATTDGLTANNTPLASTSATTASGSSVGTMTATTLQVQSLQFNNMGTVNQPNILTSSSDTSAVNSLFGTVTGQSGTTASTKKDTKNPLGASLGGGSSSTTSEDIDKKLSTAPIQHLIKITVDGSITGMDSNNQSSVAGSISNYFGSLLDSFDLSKSQTTS